MASNHRDADAMEILAEIDGDLLADIKAMRHWATLEDEPPAGMGRLNFALMAVALIGCERLGVLVSQQPSRARAGGDGDPGRYIVGFVDRFFPAKHQFKLISKILADAMRHELVHGFGGRSATASFELGLYVSSDPARLYEVRPGARPMLAINAVAFADAMLAAFAEVQRRVRNDAELAKVVVANAAIRFTTPAGVVSQWHNAVLKRSRRTPSNPRVKPTAAASPGTIPSQRRRGLRTGR